MTLARVAFQEASIFTISLVHQNDMPAMFSIYGGDNEARQFCIYGDDFLPALIDVDQALDQYQENNPDRVVVEFCDDDVIEILDLMLQTQGLEPIDPDEFNFSDTLLWIRNPVLARQMILM